MILKLSLFLIVAASGCARGQLWGMETELLAERLRNGNYELLQHLDFEELEASHARRLGDGALFYLSEIYASLELPESRRRFLEASARLEKDPWRRSAAERLLSLYRSRGMFRRQGEIAEELLDDYPEWAELALYRLESLYEQERYGELRERLAEVNAPGFEAPPFEATEEFPNPEEELLLWEIVARHQTGDNRFSEPVMELFRRHRASSYHIRVYRYLEYRGLLESSFETEERFWLELRMASALEDALLLDTLVGALGDEERRLFFGEPTAIEDYLSRALANGDNLGRLSRLVLEGLELDTGALGAPSLAILRRGLVEIADRQGDRTLAAEQFALLMREAPEWQRNSLLGNRVASLTDSAPQEALDLLEAFAAPEPDSWFLRRAVEELTTELLGRSMWEGLDRLYRVADVNGYDAATARAAVILSQGPGGESPESKRRLEAARSQTTDAYYQLMASLILGDDGSDEASGSEGPGSTEETTAVAGQPESPASSEEDLAFVVGYLDYGLLSEAFEALQERWDRISGDDAAMVARHLAREGQYYESMRIAERIRREGRAIDRRELQELRFPRAFAPILEGVSRDYDLPIWLWYALVREESYFAPAIESYAGAVGLAQLMPATAAEVAEREGITAPDLTNPETNLRLGASYLSRLLDRFDEPAHAIMAYNGGQGRMRRWLAASQEPSVILFHEAVPVHQTRHYLRKILVTASGYALLYDDQAPRETVASVFPELRVLSEES